MKPHKSYIRRAVLNILYHGIPISIILLVSVGIRQFLNTLADPYLLIEPDSIGYYGISQSIIRNPSLSIFINNFRTPLYPIFLSFITIIRGLPAIDLTSSYFFYIRDTILIVQSMWGVIGTIILYYLFRRCDFSVGVSIICALFNGCNPILIGWEHALLTEALAVPVMTIYIYLVLLMIDRPSVLKGAALITTSIASMLLRPAFICIPIITYGFLIIYTKQRQSSKSKETIIQRGFHLHSIALVVYLVFIGVYIKGNSILHGYTGINHIGDINLLGQILEYKLPPEAGKDESPLLYSAVSEYQKDQLEPSPYKLIDTIDPNMHGDITQMNQLQRFVRKVILANGIAFLKKVLEEIPGTIIDTHGNQDIFLHSNDQYIQQIVRWYLYFYQTIHVIHLVPFILFPVYFFLIHHRNNTIINTYFSFLFWILLSYVFLSTSLGTGTLGRLMAPVWPIMSLFTAMSIRTFVSPYKKI